jgi:small-conductance mechanosensitive channel
MQRVKLISKILFYITRLLSFLYLTGILYSIFCLLTGWSIIPYGDGKYLHILYPFTQQPFLNIDNNLPYILFEFIMPLLLYGLFFLLSSNVFKVFHQPKLFTAAAVQHLKNFYWANLTLPTAALFCAMAFAEVEGIAIALVFIHYILGIFVYFLSEIFKQGLKLQKEQDLFI